ncbi:hypothetical protein MRX96_040806 [Rhipicephalus microplus]
MGWRLGSQVRSAALPERTTHPLRGVAALVSLLLVVYSKRLRPPHVRVCVYLYVVRARMLFVFALRGAARVGAWGADGGADTFIRTQLSRKAATRDSGPSARALTARQGH